MMRLSESQKAIQETVITIGAMLVARPEDECEEKLTTYADRVQDLSPIDVTTRFEIVGVERIDPVLCAGTVRFTVESPASSVKPVRPVREAAWVVNRFEEQLGRAERVLYAFDKHSVRLGTREADELENGDV